MAPASLRVSRSDGDDQTAFVLQDLPLMRQGLHLKHLDLIEAVQRWVRFRTPHASFPHQNVRISSFLSTQSPSIMPTESILLHRRESELLANFVEKIRIPSLNFSRFTAANMFSINHIFAGTVARTLSQSVKKTSSAMYTATIESPLTEVYFNPQGPSDLYRGEIGVILGTVPYALLYFSVYESSKSRLEKYLPTELLHVVSASMGTVVASVVRVPSDTLKHQVQAYMVVFEAFRSVVTAEGIGGLYKGFWPTLLRDVPEIAIQFGVYEKLRAVLQAKRDVTELTYVSPPFSQTPEHLALGACAGAIAAALTMPLDLVKTRQQCGISQGIPRIVMSVMQEKGAAGLFTGLGARALHASLTSALSFGLYEYCKMMMNPDHMGHDEPFLPKMLSKRHSKIWKRQRVRH
ncbi:unnamed protein product [Sphagnum troendelagicum]|uniref:Mitochondrial carrier protein n=1 Tax=Sphagnum troendelagicum TaxID=128251 RepID=A0ABP0V340_9BRYO